MANDTTIAVLSTALVLDGRTPKPGAAMTLYGDQPVGEIKTNVTRKGVTFVESDFPRLLRVIADFMEQEGAEDLTGLWEAVADKGKP